MQRDLITTKNSINHWWSLDICENGYSIFCVNTWTVAAKNQPTLPQYR